MNKRHDGESDYRKGSTKTCTSDYQFNEEEVLRYSDAKDISIQWMSECADLKLLAERATKPLEILERAWNSARTEQEFSVLGKITMTNFHCLKLVDYFPEMDKHNRYANIYPFAYNQVKLGDPFESDDSDRYLNASYIQSPSSFPGPGPAKYIASQAPPEASLPSFFTLLWTHQIAHIFCLTRLREEGRVKATKYWPAPGKTLEVGQFEVTREDKVDKGFFKESKIVIQDTGTGEKRSVSHYHITKWPDNKSPSEANLEDLLNLCALANQKFREISQDSDHPPPLLVHCSAGVGRTGCFIALTEIQELLSEALKDPFRTSFDSQDSSKPANDFEVVETAFKNLSVFEIVRRLREQRWGAVKTLQQYQFIYIAFHHLLKKFKFSTKALPPLVQAVSKETSSDSSSQKTEESAD